MLNTGILAPPVAPPPSGPSFPQFGSYYIGGQSGYGASNYINWSAFCRVIVFNGFDGFGAFGGVGTTPASICAAIKAINPNTGIAQYFEPWEQPNTNTSTYAPYTAATAGNWWLRATYPSGAIKTDNSTSLNNMDVLAGGTTISTGTPAVSRDWIKWGVDWTFDYAQAGNTLGLAEGTNLANSNITGIFHDDTKTTNSELADYQRTGTAQAIGDATTSALMRQGFAAMYARGFVNNPSGLVGLNSSGIPTFGSTPTEWAGTVNFVVAEGSIGYQWSIESNFSFSTFVASMGLQAGCLTGAQYYIFAHGNLTTSGADPSAFAGTFPFAPTAHYPNWTGARYGLGVCMALCPAQTPLWWPCPGDNFNTGYDASNAGTLWFDEMAINSSTNAPYSQYPTAAQAAYLGTRDGVGVLDATSGCYYATFTNATTSTRWIVIVNPKGGSSTASINVLGLTGKHFKFFNGTQDATTNNGTTVSSVTFANARDGRFGQLV